MAIQLKKLEAEVQHQQAALQQEEKARRILGAKVKVLEDLVTSTNATVNLLQTQVQGMQPFIEPDIDSRKPVVNDQETMAANINQQTAIPGSATAVNDPNSSGMPCPSAAYNAHARGSTNKARIQEVYGKEALTGYEPGKGKVTGADTDQAVLEEAQELYREIVFELAAMVLHLETNPDDTAAVAQMHDLLNSFGLKAQWFRVFHRMPIYRLKTCNLETGAMTQLAPEGHWQNIALLLSDK